MLTPQPPAIRQEAGMLCLSGSWQMESLGRHMLWQHWQQALQQAAPQVQGWDLRAIDEMDHIGAQMLWQSWGRRRPAQLLLGEGQDALFQHLEQAATLHLPTPAPQRLAWLQALGEKIIGFGQHLRDITQLLGQFSLDLLRFLRAPWHGPWKEISANIYRAGFQALGITALVGVLIGIVLSYLSAQQLRNFGADTFIVNMLGIAILRELGPMLAAILVAGRSGSAITAQLGVMRVTEELDAMLVMGISHGFRLILPKVLALAIAMPLLVIWTDVAALAGGMLAAYVELHMAPEFFLFKLRDAVPLLNYWLGLGKGVVFGILIALVACHFGMRIKPNTESLGRGTTASVVTSITVVIFADAIFAVVFRGIGIMF